MRVFFAGHPGTTCLSAFYENQLGKIENRLLSYHYISAQTKMEAKYFEEHRDRRRSKVGEAMQKDPSQPHDVLMIDSGAFTVWSKGLTVDLDEYIAFCLEYLDVVDYFVALDVIPGRKDDPYSLTKATIDKACKEGWENYQRMLAAGLPRDRLIPVFHQRENWEWLERFLEEEIPYFGLGTIKSLTTRQHFEWLDGCMEIACDKDGMPKAKFHGFGVNGLRMLKRYPWWSCDGTAWIKMAMYGGAMIPRWTAKGEWNYLSDRSPAIDFSTQANMTSRWSHYSSLPPTVQTLIKRYLDEIGIEVGLSSYRKEPKGYKHRPRTENVFARHKDHVVIEEIVVRGVTNDSSSRMLVNKHFLEEVSRRLEWPRPFQHMRKRRRLL